MRKETWKVEGSVEKEVRTLLHLDGRRSNIPPSPPLFTRLPRSRHGPPLKRKQPFSSLPMRCYWCTGAPVSQSVPLLFLKGSKTKLVARKSRSPGETRGPWFYVLAEANLRSGLFRFVFETRCRSRYAQNWMRRTLEGDRYHW